MSSSKNPFIGEDGVINFPYQPMSDIVFVWPDGIPEKIGSLFIPEFVRENYRSSSGIVLAVGKGCYVKKFKKWIDTTVKVGDYILFDKDIPFSLMVKAPDGEEYRCLYFGEKDTQGIIKGE